MTNLVSYAKEHGVENIRIVAPMKPNGNEVAIAFTIDGEIPTTCTIDTSKYDIFYGYKVTLVSKGFYSKDYYIDDLNNLLATHPYYNLYVED